MTKRLTAVLLIAIGILVTLVSISIVSATHYGTTKHWHSEEAEYKLLTDELPDSWEDKIREAAEGWDDRSIVTITEDTSSNNTIKRGAVSGSWLGEGCYVSSIACTKLSPGGGRHILNAKMLLNEIYNFGTKSIGCFFNQYDVQSIAAHEFGHFAGKLDHSTDPDERSVMQEDYWACIRIPNSHDIDTMDAQYDDHP